MTSKMLLVEIRLDLKECEKILLETKEKVHLLNSGESWLSET